METSRVALISYTAPDGTQCVGSGLFTDDRRVLTADHVAVGTGHRIGFPGGSRDVVAILRSGSADVDLAVLTVSQPVEVAAALKYARVDRSRVSQLNGSVAVGFPRWRKDGGVRRSAQVNGSIPTAEGLEPAADSGLRAGFLTLVGDRIPGAPEILPGALTDERPNPWGGMSGAGVVVDGFLVGVVRSHNLASGGQSLTVTPLTAIERLPPGVQEMFWEALGVTDPNLLPALPADGDTKSASRRIRDYLDAARMVAEQHPYALTLPGAPDLPSVYLHQMMIPQSDPGSHDVQKLEPVKSSQQYPAEIRVTDQELRERLAKAVDTSAERIAEALQRFGIEEVLGQHRGAVLVGGPGTGKSSLLRHILHEFSTSLPEGASTLFIPVLVQARALVGDLSFPNAIAKAVTADLGSLLDDSNLAEIFADQPGPGIPWLVLLDGVDEVLDREDRTGVLLTVARWWADRRYRFLVTSRMLSFVELQILGKVRAPFFEMQQFDEDELPELARRWFASFGASDVPGLVDNFMAQLTQSRLSQLARNPLIATMMCVIFLDDAEHAIPHNRADLYENFVALLMNKAIYQLRELEQLQKQLGRRFGSASQDAVDRLLARSRRLMEDLAHQQLVAATEESLIEFAEGLSVDLRPENVTAPVWRGVLEEVIRQSGLILERDNDLVFIHHTVMEYLAACKSAAKEPDRLSRWRLRVAAGRGDPLALFTITVMWRNGIDLLGRAPRMLALRRLVHARLVASLANEGLRLPAETVDLARERLVNFTTRHNCVPDGIRDRVWEYEDDCVLAAKSLVLLDRDSGLAALARTAIDPRVGGFNIYGYGEFLELDRERGLTIMADLASSSEIEGFDRIGVILYLLEASRALGIPVAEKMSIDRSVEPVFRVQMASKLLEFDRDKGVRALAFLVADPSNEPYREFCETVLTEIDPRVCTTAMGELMVKSETVLSDRFGTARRLIRRDRSLALNALAQVALDPQISDFARAGAAVMLSEQSASAGMLALRGISGDERVAGFHRVFCLEWSWRTSGGKDRLLELMTLALKRGMSARWRLFAAGQLAGVDRELGLETLTKMTTDPSLPRSWRGRAWAFAVALRRFRELR